MVFVQQMDPGRPQLMTQHARRKTLQTATFTVMPLCPGNNCLRCYQIMPLKRCKHGCLQWLGEVSCPLVLQISMMPWRRRAAFCASSPVPPPALTQPARLQLPQSMAAPPDLWLPIVKLTVSCSALSAASTSANQLPEGLQSCRQRFGSSCLQRRRHVVGVELEVRKHV